MHSYISIYIRQLKYSENFFVLLGFIISGYVTLLVVYITVMFEQNYICIFKLPKTKIPDIHRERIYEDENKRTGNSTSRHHSWFIFSTLVLIFHELCLILEIIS